MDELIKYKTISKECDQENFLARDIVEKIKVDNYKMSNLIELMQRISKKSQGARPKIWKPKRFILPKGIGYY